MLVIRPSVRHPTHGTEDPVRVRPGPPCQCQAPRDPRHTTPTSLRLEPDAAVEPNDLRIHIVVLDQRAHQMAELIRPPESLRKYHWCRQPGKELVGVPAAAGDRLVDRGEDDPRADRVDPDADDRKVTRRWNRHPDDPALGCRVGDLPRLALDPRDRGGV